MVVDAVEDVSDICLRAETVELGGLDDGHGAGQSFRPSVCSCEEPIFPSDSDGAQGTPGWIIVDGHTPVGQELAKGVPTAQTIAESLGRPSI